MKDGENNEPISFRILSLDGGGAKGVYSLGVLSRLERDAGKPLHEVFDLIYGTSTGSIIATMISLGYPISQIYEFYLKEIPKILSPISATRRSSRLSFSIREILKDRTFSDLKIPTGIVATNWESQTPLIFKNFEIMAHSGSSSFIPGFGVPLADAIQSSCSAVPLFKPVSLSLGHRGGAVIQAYDGGFSANNPSLFSLIDAKAMGFDLRKTALFSVGVGHYPTASLNCLNRVIIRIFGKLPSVSLLGGVLEVSSNTTRIIQKLILKEVRSIRFDETFNTPNLGTDLLETNTAVLRRLFGKGTETYQSLESKAKELL